MPGCPRTASRSGTNGDFVLAPSADRFRYNNRLSFSRSVVKKFPSKAEQRQQLAREVDEFLQDGGEISEVPRGVSGRESPLAPSVWRPTGSTDREPPAPRTDLTEVVAALETRRQALKKPPRPTLKRARKIVVYDDFGVPLREVWRDD